MKIKNLIFITIWYSVFNLSTHAQSFGIKGGLNMSNITYEQTAGTVKTFQNKYGFHLGLTSEFGKKFAFAPEVIFSLKGDKYESTGNGTISESFYYIEVPLNLKYTYDIGAAKLFGQAGPYFGVVAKYTLKDKDGTNYPELTSIGNSEDDDLKRTDYGIDFGGGLQFNKIAISLTYSLGLANTLPTKEIVQRNKVICVSIGYKFK